jgi:hypothetical protein
MEGTGSLEQSVLINDTTVVAAQPYGVFQFTTAGYKLNPTPYGTFQFTN